MSNLRQWKEQDASNLTMSSRTIPRRAVRLINSSSLTFYHNHVTTAQLTMLAMTHRGSLGSDALIRKRWVFRMQL
jgi:hypothetical protein